MNKLWLPVTLWLSIAGCISINLAAGPSPLQETVVQDNDADFKVAVIDIAGTMAIERDSGPMPFGGNDNIVGRTREQLDLAEADEEVRAVVVRISSPGGGVYPSLAVYRDIRRFAEQSSKPVVAYIPDVGASGGYLAAVAADEIIADQASITGSIGVIAMFPEVWGFLDWMKIRVNTIKAGERKDMGSPLRAMSEADRADFGAITTYYHDIFKSMVDTRRENLSAEQVAAIADGRVFTADKALEAGLVDAIGTLDDAHGRAAELAALSAETTNLVMYRRPGEYNRSMHTMAPNPGVHISLDANALITPRAQFLYLWQPGS
jgi:protease-4